MKEIRAAGCCEAAAREQPEPREQALCVLCRAMGSKKKEIPLQVGLKRRLLPALG